MKYPDIVVVPGTDANIVYNNLKSLNIVYKIHCYKISTELTKLIIGSEQFLFDKLQTGMTFDLFISKSNTTYLLYDFNFIYEPFDITADLDLWSYYTSLKEKRLITALIYYGLNEDKELLDIYKKFLLPTFKNPLSQLVLQWCIIRKTLHVKMWHDIIKTLNIYQLDEDCYPKYQPGTNLNDITDFLSRAVILHERSYTCLLSCFKHFDKFVNLFKAIERKDRETVELGKKLQIISNEMIKQYPFLNILMNERMNHYRINTDRKEMILFRHFRKNLYTKYFNSNTLLNLICLLHLQY